jgi:predicted AAA+ superfamily ATPase
MDFVCTDHDNRLYVQSSWTIEDEETAEREYSSLESIGDSYPKIVVTMDDIVRKNRNGIQNIHAWNLEDYLAKLYRGNS